MSAALDSSDAVGNTAYTLEVTSRGISRPLERPAHWRRNRGRLVAVTTADGNTVTGRIVCSRTSRPCSWTSTDRSARSPWPT